MTTITTANGGLDVCQEALVLLRQDRELPVSGGALDTTSDVVAKKVDRVYDSTRALIIGAHGWDGLTLTGGDNQDIKNGWPKQIRAAFVALLARELALPVTGRQEDLKAMHELYKMKLLEAVKKDFEEAVGKETDKLTLAVYAVCKGYLKDGEPLPWSWGAFKARVGDATNAAKMEVDNALKWSTKFTGAADDWRYPAYERLVTAKMAASVGAGVEQQNLLLQAYKVELETAKKKDLETAIAAETDKLTLAVYAVCKGYLKDGEPLPWSWAGFKARVGDAKVAAKVELEGAHGWHCPFSDDPKDWRWAAFERLVTAKMAASVGAGVEQQNLMFQAYRRALDEAVAKDWRHGICGEQDPIVKDVFIGIQERANGDAQKDWNYGRMREIVISLKDRIRKEVLAERDWNFARRSMDVVADEDGLGKWRAVLPHDCLKIHSVEGVCRAQLARDGWWIEDGFLQCRGDHPVAITYTADVKNVERWDPLVREAYFTLLMCRIVKATPEINVRAQLLNGEYAELIRKAAIKDAKETQPGRVCWGPNDYADAIRGSRGSRCSRGFRGGYVR